MSKLKRCIAAILIAANLFFFAGCAGSVQTAQPTQTTVTTQTAATPQAVTQTAGPSPSIMPSVSASSETINTSKSENQKEAESDGPLKLEPGHVELKPNTDYQIDLDKDGVTDHFSVHDKRDFEEAGDCTIVLSVNGVEYKLGGAFGIGQIFLVFNENLEPVLIINNDGSSDDYYCWSIPLDQVKIKDIYSHGGEVEDISGNTITILDYIYVLGSYYAQSYYTLNEKGKLVAMTTDTWYFSSDYSKHLTLKKDLSAKIKVNYSYQNKTITAGNKIWLTAVEYIGDTNLVAYFKTQNDEMGKFYFSLDKDSHNGPHYIINNISDKDMFVDLPYSG